MTFNPKGDLSLLVLTLCVKNSNISPREFNLTGKPDLLTRLQQTILTNRELNY